MSAPPYMRLYWADYHQDTRHLTRDEHGAYFLLLGEAWNRGGFLPDDDALLARWALSTIEEWSRLKSVVMAYFRPASRGRWRHKRVAEELSAYEEVSRKRKAAGKRGGAASGGTKKEIQEAIAEQKPTKREPEPEPEPIEERSSDLFVVPALPAPTAKKPAAVYPDLFEAAWKAYPHVRGRSSKADTLDRWKRLPDATRQALPAAAAAYAREGREPKMDCGAQAMERWLKGGKFADWIGSADQGSDWPDSRWAQAVAMWRAEGSWGESLGPTPGQPGCRVPPHLLIQPTAQGSAA